MATVPKKELAKRTGDKLRMPDADVMRIIQMFLDMIVERLAVGERFELRDFGVFEVVKRQAKKARNPRTGERATIPPERPSSSRTGES